MELRGFREGWRWRQSSNGNGGCRPASWARRRMTDRAGAHRLRARGVTALEWDGETLAGHRRRARALADPEHDRRDRRVRRPARRRPGRCAATGASAASSAAQAEATDATRAGSPPARRASCQAPEHGDNLADILERVLDKGIVIAGDIQINLLDIELLTIKLRLLVASVDKAREMGIDWWESDPSLQSSSPATATARTAARAREPGAARAPRAPRAAGGVRR